MVYEPCFIEFFGGTGSYPPGKKPLHRASRFVIRKRALKREWVCRAERA
jgi:hypothetical protein